MGDIVRSFLLLLGRTDGAWEGGKEQPVHKQTIEKERSRLLPLWAIDACNRKSTDCLKE